MLDTLRLREKITGHLFIYEKKMIYLLDKPGSIENNRHFVCMRANHALILRSKDAQCNTRASPKALSFVSRRYSVWSPKGRFPFYQKIPEILVGM